MAWPSALALRRGIGEGHRCGGTWGMPRLANCIVIQSETRKNGRELWLNGQFLGNRTEGKPGVPRTLPLVSLNGADCVWKGRAPRNAAKSHAFAMG